MGERTEKCRTCAGKGQIPFIQSVPGSRERLQWMDDCPRCDGTGRRATTEPEEARDELCHAGRDGECNWSRCPQIRDGEPHATGRHCPIDTREDF